MNPFITHWNEPFAGKEKRVANFCLHGLNSDRSGADQLFHPDLSSQEGYQGSVWESELCEDKSLTLFFTGREKLFAERGI